MRCGLSTTSSAYLRLLVSGSAQTCLNEQVLENHLKRKLIENRQLLNADCEENEKCFSEARRSAAIAGGAPVFEVFMKGPKWASQVLKLLAEDGSSRGLVALGIACVEGLAVSSFGQDDAQRLLFFCNRQGEEPCSMNIDLMRFPSWLRPPAPSRNRSEASEGAVSMSKKRFLAALRPIPHIRPFRKFTDISPCDAGVVSNNVANWKSTPGSSQAPQPVLLHSVKMKKHECGRSPIQVCSEEAFLKDLMQFLVLQGHTKLIPKGGSHEFPATVLFDKPLDLFNMYKAVVSIGGFHVGDAINWRRLVFPKMRNYKDTDRGVRKILRKHYETFLLAYELAHDDVDGKCCLFCHSGAAGDWIKCGTCREWAHYGCDKRPRPASIGAFEVL